MPSSSVRAFTDPDELEAAVRLTTFKLSIIGNGPFTGNIVNADLHRLRIQRSFDNLPRVSYAVGMPGRATILFRTGEESELFHNGQAFLSTSVKRYLHTGDFFGRTSGPSSVGTMSLSVEDMASASVIGGFDLTSPHDAVTVSPPAAALERLRRLHATVGGLADDAPAIIAHPEASRSLEQALIEAMIHCFGSGEIGEERAAQRQHAAIMRRFQRITEEHPDDPIYITELCKEIGASERTLNTCCREYLGMGAKHYLLLSRMHMVRRTLRRSAPADTTVTEVAMRYGFWQLGRFAGKYRAVFGESPSDTLARVE